MSVREWIAIHGDLIRRCWLHEKEAQRTQPLGPQRRLRRLGELLFVLSIERQRLLEVAEARRRYPQQPEAVYRLNPLKHVRTQRQLSASQQHERMMEKQMRAARVPIATELVLVGGGHAHVHVLRMLGMEPMEGVRVTLIAKDVETPYSGMLPAHVAGLYTRAECHIDLHKLARFARVRLIQAEATHIDTARRLVELGTSRPAVPYDVLSLNVGITPQFPFESALSSGVTPVKPIAGFSKTWDALLAKLATWNDDAKYDVVVVGGGAGGVELALAMRARVRAALVALGKSPDLARFSLVTRGPRIMTSHADGVKTCMEAVLAKRDIQVVANCEAVGVEGSAIACRFGGTSNGELKALPFDECVWCTQAAAPPVLRASGLDCDELGFAQIDEYQRCASADQDDRDSLRIFAAGDCATVLGHPRPKAGVFAVMAGMALYANIAAECSGSPQLAHLPQTSFLGLIGTGDGSCVASRGQLAFQADWLWQLKDWIDRKWMWQYTHGLPDMSQDTPTARPPAAFERAGEAGLALLRQSTMRCGGCGAKVGATALSQALSQLPIAPVPQHAQVEAGVDAADDAGIVVYQNTTRLAHTIDFFRALVDDPYLLGQIAANHALSDCDAMNAQAASAVALVVVPYAAERSVQSDLLQVMRGVRKTLDAAGCALVGGHTCEGAELSVGLAVNGVLSEPTLTKGGVRAGDALILTKPIGTGCIFAADMRAKAAYPIVKAATDSMLISNRAAAAILAEADCSACTDVTGFGLLGHLSEMCRASAGACVDLDLDAVPYLPGVLNLAAAGLFSSLQPENVRAKRAVQNHDSHVGKPAYALLFDPQTAGGLLASVAPSQVTRVLTQLREAGYDAAARIGSVRTSADPTAYPASVTIFTTSD